MATATATAPAPAPAPQSELDVLLADLCKHLAPSGPTLVEKLPDRLRELGVLSAAIIKGYIEVGQRDYALIAKEVRVREVPDEHDKRVVRQQVEKDMVADIGSSWTWTDLKGPKRKQLHEILEEEEHKTLPEECRLHVRVTSLGLTLTV